MLFWTRRSSFCIYITIWNLGPWGQNSNIIITARSSTYSFVYLFMLSFRCRPIYKLYTHMGLIFSFTPIYISAIQFKLTNNADETFQIAMCEPKQYEPGFSPQLTPNQTDEARVSQHLVVWFVFVARIYRVVFSPHFRLREKMEWTVVRHIQSKLLENQERWQFLLPFFKASLLCIPKMVTSPGTMFFWPLHHPSLERLWPALLRSRISRLRKRPYWTVDHRLATVLE